MQDVWCIFIQKWKYNYFKRRLYVRPFNNIVSKTYTISTTCLATGWQLVKFLNFGNFTMFKDFSKVFLHVSDRKKFNNGRKEMLKLSIALQIVDRMMRRKFWRPVKNRNIQQWLGNSYNNNLLKIWCLLLVYAHFCSVATLLLRTLI